MIYEVVCEGFVSHSQYFLREVVCENFEVAEIIVVTIEFKVTDHSNLFFLLHVEVV